MGDHFRIQAYAPQTTTRFNRKSSELLASLPWRTHCIVLQQNLGEILGAPEYQPLLNKLEVLEDWEIKADKATFAMLRVIEQGSGQDGEVVVSFAERKGLTGRPSTLTPRLINLLTALRVVDILAWIHDSGLCTTVPYHRRRQHIGGSTRRVRCILLTFYRRTQSSNSSPGKIWSIGLTSFEMQSAPLNVAQILHPLYLNCRAII